MSARSGGDPYVKQTALRPSSVAAAMAPFTSAIPGAVVATFGIVTAVFHFGLVDVDGRPQSRVRERRRFAVLSGSPAFSIWKYSPTVGDHGTTRLGMTRYSWNSMKATTQFNHLTNREGFIIVYSTQRRNRAPAWGS
jgi:hypothetical protein